MAPRIFFILLAWLCIMNGMSQIFLTNFLTVSFWINCSQVNPQPRGKVKSPNKGSNEKQGKNPKKVCNYNMYLYVFDNELVNHDIVVNYSLYSKI